ncbi:MAG: hypothetical protein AB7O24_26450 [Kofleriaceae bacterium]
MRAKAATTVDDEQSFLAVSIAPASSLLATVDDEQSFLAVSIAPASSLLATVAELGSEAEAICPSAAVKRKPLPPPTTSSRSTRDLYSR